MTSAVRYGYSLLCMPRNVETTARTAASRSVLTPVPLPTEKRIVLDWIASAHAEPSARLLPVNSPADDEPASTPGWHVSASA